MKEIEAKLIESMADSYSNLLKEAKSMGCNEIRALYNIPLKNMELIINALEKQIPKKPKKIEAEVFRYTDAYRCPLCCGNFYGTGIADYCYHCGQKLDWSDEE